MDDWRPIARMFVAAIILEGLLICSACSRTPPSLTEQREEMVRTQLIGRGITDGRIVAAFRTVPREAFVLPRFREHAYDDLEAPIGFGQSLDRPYENAAMLKALELAPTDRVLEVGTGSGYLSALMSRIAQQVFTIEIEPDIADAARKNISGQGTTNIEIRTGDGFLGWPERAPFDAIVLACSPERIPEPLTEQLAEGGRLLLPLGGTEKFQELVLYTKRGGKLLELRRIGPTTFSPMKGKILEDRR